MLIRASAFAVGKDFDQPLGALIQSGGTWFVRAQIKDRGESIDVAIAISGDNLGDVIYFGNPSSCVHLAQGLGVEYRIAGAIEGPGTPPAGALVWSVDGKEQAFAVNGTYVTQAGTESKSCSKDRAFYARNWGAWLVGEDGKDVGDEALFFNKIAGAQGVTTAAK